MRDPNLTYEIMDYGDVCVGSTKEYPGIIVQGKSPTETIKEIDITLPFHKQSLKKYKKKWKDRHYKMAEKVDKMFRENKQGMEIDI